MSIPYNRQDEVRFKALTEVLAAERAGELHIYITDSEKVKGGGSYVSIEWRGHVPKKRIDAVLSE